MEVFGLCVLYGYLVGVQSRCGIFPVSLGFSIDRGASLAEEVGC
jgi:hypothetical protein